jgi:hypothetical protein
VDLVSPPQQRIAARGSLGSCISETPSPMAELDAGGGVAAPLAAGAALVSDARAAKLSLARDECVITGLPANDRKLAHKLQHSAQVTAATLRNALHHTLGWPLGKVGGETREALIVAYCAALNSAPPNGAADSRGEKPARSAIKVVDRSCPAPGTEPPGECPAHKGGHGAARHCETRPSSRRSQRCEDSESDIDDLTARPARCSSPQPVARNTTSSLWQRTEAKLRRGGGAGGNAGPCPADEVRAADAGNVIGTAGAEGEQEEEREDEGLWHRLQRKCERELQLRTAEDAESQLPLWSRLEARQQRACAPGKQPAAPAQEKALDLQHDTDDDDDDIFAARGGLLGDDGGARGRAGRRGAGAGAAGAAQEAECVDGGASDSRDSIADRTCGEPCFQVHRKGGGLEGGSIERGGGRRQPCGHGGEARVQEMREQMEHQVALLERLRDEKVRTETAAAVAALDFEGAALLQRSIHADFQRKISAAAAMWQQKMRGDPASGAHRGGGGGGGGENSSGQPAASGQVPSVEKSQGKSPNVGKSPGKYVCMPKYSEMSVPDLKKAMSRYFVLFTPCVCRFWGLRFSV